MPRSLPTYYRHALMANRTSTKRHKNRTEKSVTVGYKECMSIRVARFNLMRYPVTTERTINIELRTCIYNYKVSINYEEYLRRVAVRSYIYIPVLYTRCSIYSIALYRVYRSINHNHS